MGRYAKKLCSRFQELKRKLQHNFKDCLPSISQSKPLPDKPATASELERTRRSAAPSLEMAPKEDNSL
jgi:hypothetical protein